MAIDAVVTEVTYNLDGTAVMKLGPRVADQLPGQDSLLVLNPPRHFDAIVGTRVWGNSKFLMVRDKKLGRRIGYGQVKIGKG
jgi:hypothetical protein